MINSGHTACWNSGGGALYATTALPLVVAMKHNNALSLHSHDPNNNQEANELIEKIANARINSIPSNSSWDDLEDNEKTSNQLPAEIATGETGWRFLFAYDQMPAGNPAITGTFVIRHTLPGTYTVSGAVGMTLGSSTTVDVNGVSMTRIEVTNIQQQNCWFDVTGPVGAFPSDWDIQFLRASDEAAFDNDSLPIWHATRFFIPEYLNIYATWKPHHKRFMKALRTERSLYNTFAQFPKPTDRVIQSVYPIEMCVGFCNHIDCGGWFNFPMAASEDLIDHWADFVIANMNPDLPVIYGHGNEHWNVSGYNTINYYMYEGLKQFGTQGAGTITFDGTTITNDGSVDFTTLFASGQATKIAVDHPGYDGGGIAWSIKPGTLTATTVEVNATARYKIPLPGPANWYHNSPSPYEMHDRGYMYRSTHAMKRLTDKFTAAGQMGRLVRMYEAQLANPATKNPLFDAATSYWTGPGSLDPLDYHDGIAINMYFGDGYWKPAGLNTSNTFKEAIRAAAEADPPDQAAYNSMVRDFCLGNPISGVTPTNDDLWWMKKRIMKWEKDCASKGLGLWAYEGGHHLVHLSATDADDKPIFDLWRTWLTSPEAQEVYEVWRDIQIPYLSGPIMKFTLFGQTNRYGAYGLFLDYGTDESNNKEVAVVDSIRQMPAFWLPENPPTVTAVEDQNWTVGVQPKARHDVNENFSLYHYASKNVTSYGGTPPAGMTMNTATGEMLGSPVAGSGVYVFTATSPGGTVNIPVNITVDP